MSRAGVWSDPRRVIGALVLGGYAAIALAVENLYPVSVFDMYSRPRSSASRIVARDAAGSLVEVRRYDRWRCEGPLDLSPRACNAPRFDYSNYLDAEHAAYVASHSTGDGHGEPVEIVRRIWWLDQPGPPRTTDCVLQRCTAVRR